MRPDNYTSAYLDACVISRYLGDMDRWAKVGSLLDLGDAGKVKIYLSPMVIVEALGQSPGKRFDEGIEQAAGDLLSNPLRVHVEFDDAVAYKARSLRHTYPKLGAADAIHLASAVVASVDVFFTHDGQDFPMNSRVYGVWVCEPYLPELPTAPMEFPG